jgi:hypothetical protein
MDNTLEEKPLVPERSVKPKKTRVMEQALAQLDAALELERQHESWWSILVYWIQELRWRRVFWEKMGRPPEQEIKQ